MNISFPYTKFPHEHVLNRGSRFRERLCRLRSCLAQGGSIEAGGLDLLNQAVGLGNDHKCYAIQLEETLLSGCAVELRELLCPFGDYFGAPRSLYPYYPHTDAVNFITTSLARVRLGIDRGNGTAI